jgi:hypothetical protein
MHARNIFNLYFQARHNGQNYVFALLTGYRDPPAGVVVNSPYNILQLNSLLIKLFAGVVIFWTALKAWSTSVK